LYSNKISEEEEETNLCKGNLELYLEKCGNAKNERKEKETQRMLSIHILLNIDNIHFGSSLHQGL
jgi:hypothetical protein